MAGVEKEFQAVTFTSELKFTATPDKGEVSALLIRPQNATRLLVLAHGASTNMRHATMQSIADALAARKIPFILASGGSGTAQGGVPGCHAILEKPYALADVRAAIERLKKD